MNKVINYLIFGGHNMKPGIGVGIMVLKDNKILLGLRKTNKD